MENVPKNRKKLIIYVYSGSCMLISVSDPYHFDADPDPDPRIRFRDDGSKFPFFSL